MSILLWIVCMAQVCSILAVGVYTGKEFVISPPSIEYEYDQDTNYPRLTLFVISPDNNKIFVRQENYLLDKTDLDQPLKPFQLFQISREKLYHGSDVTSGSRWTYRVYGNDAFALMVCVQRSLYIGETFAGVPITAWGSHYAIITLEREFSVVLLSDSYGNEITFKLRFQDPSQTLTIGDVVHEHGKEIKINLERYQAWAISNCQINGPGSLTGSFAHGIKPFGVITGNCNGTTEIQRCHSSYGSSLLTASTGSYVAEMLLPVETAGHYFVLFTMTGRHTPGYFIILTLHDFTGVTIWDHGAKQIKYITLIANGSSVVEKGEFGTAHASNPVQIMYIQNSSCFFMSEGDPSMLIVTPVELFYYVYYIMTPILAMRHFLTVVVRTDARDSLKAILPPDQTLILGLATPSPREIKWHYPPLGTFVILEYEIVSNASFTLYSLKTRFGCYVHGAHPYGTYMHSAGFISSNINAHFCQKEPMKKDDFLDNDCDEWVDEEDANGINDDIFKHSDKGAIDEDVGSYFDDGDNVHSIFIHIPPDLLHKSLSDFNKDYIHPTYEYTRASDTVTTMKPEKDLTPSELQADFDEWSEWQCSSNCDDQDQTRSRICLRKSSTEKCKGPKVQTRKAECFLTGCPTKICNKKQFGDKCKFNCTNCKDDCDRFDGSCGECSAGYEYPETGCQIDTHQYEDWTIWKCTEECGRPYMFRERKAIQNSICNEDYRFCIKDLKERMTADCRVEKICPKNCPSYSWGPDCVNSCENCEKPCHKYTGECSFCRGGFKNETTGCVTPCEVNEYGAGCTLKCNELCGEGHDCIDREVGSCPAIPAQQNSNYIFLAVLIIVIVAAASSLYFVFKFKKIEELEVARSMTSLKAERSRSRQSLRSQRSSGRLSAKGKVKDEGTVVDSANGPTEAADVEKAVESNI